MKKYSLLIGIFTFVMSISTEIHLNASTAIVPSSVCSSTVISTARANWSRIEVAGILKSMLSEKFCIGESLIQENSSFKYDLGMDSLDMLDFLYDCESKFGINYPDTIMDTFDSLLFGQFVDETMIRLNS